MKETRPPLFVLVIEDEEDGANSLCELLQLVGYRVAVARTGTAALRTARIDRPDVVLLDIRLPDINGWQVAQRMRDMATGGAAAGDDGRDRLRFRGRSAAVRGLGSQSSLGQASRARGPAVDAGPVREPPRPCGNAA